MGQPNLCRPSQRPHYRCTAGLNSEDHDASITLPLHASISILLLPPRLPRPPIRPSSDCGVQGAKQRRRSLACSILPDRSMASSHTTVRTNLQACAGRRFGATGSRAAWTGRLIGSDRLDSARGKEEASHSPVF